MTRRILFVYLPFFPIERHIKMSQLGAQNQTPWWDEQAQHQTNEKPKKKGPLVLVQNGVKGTRISAVGPDGYRDGLWPDMKLADARTMLPDLQVEPHDVAADDAAFRSLAHWLLRYSPAVATYQDNAFALDISGCDHLFGGEKMMVEDIAKRFEKTGFNALIAVADNLATCFGLANYGMQSIAILPPNAPVETMDRLAIEALRLDNDTITLLKRLGLKKIGDVRALPRAALERRFRQSKSSTALKKQSASAAQSVQWRLDQLSGNIPEPLSYIKEPHYFRASQSCPELALQPEAVGIALDALLPTLCNDLEKAGKGARQFTLAGYRADGGASHISVSLSQAASKPMPIKRLFADRLVQIDCGFGIDLFVLEAAKVEPLNQMQNAMIRSDKTSELCAPAFASFADLVSNRAGPKSVFKLRPCASHVPERTQRCAPVNAAVDWKAWRDIQPKWSPRPLRLLPSPEPADVTAELPDSPPMQFVWRRVLRKVIRARGPERILPEWWHDNLKSKQSASYRDYYDVEDAQGLRYWIYRATKNEAIVQSDNDDTDSEVETMITTCWFVHGLF